VFPAADLVVELHGWAGPGESPAIVGRARRVLHCTWHDVVERPSIVLAEIAGAVAARQGHRTQVISATCPCHAGPLGEQARPAAGYPKT
jgi:hypothetical protein